MQQWSSAESFGSYFDSAFDSDYETEFEQKDWKLLIYNLKNKELKEILKNLDKPQTILQRKNGDIVLVVIDGDFTVKRYKKLGENIFLYPELKLDVPFLGKEIVNGSQQNINWTSKNLNGRLINLYYGIVWSKIFYYRIFTKKNYISIHKNRLLNKLCR